MQYGARAGVLSHGATCPQLCRAVSREVEHASAKESKRSPAFASGPAGVEESRVRKAASAGSGAMLAAMRRGTGALRHARGRGPWRTEIAMEQAFSPPLGTLPPPRSGQRDRNLRMSSGDPMLRTDAPAPAAWRCWRRCAEPSSRVRRCAADCRPGSSSK